VPLVGDPVDIGVLALDEAVLDGEEVGSVAGELSAAAVPGMMYSETRWFSPRRTRTFWKTRAEQPP
jgi:hypothetical protein